MALSDFLNNGELPAGSTYTSKVSETVLPDWYTNYAMQLLSNQQALSANPLQLYQGPRVAEFSPTQQQAFGMTGQAATAYQPALTQATQATQGAMAAPGALATAQPFIGQATALNPVAEAATDFGTARGLTGQAAQATQGAMAAPGALAAAQPYIQQAMGLSPSGTAEADFGTARSLAGQAASANISGAAEPYLAQAGQTSVANIGQYMNPYTDAVVNRIGELGARNLSENIMPGIEGRYIAAGQLGFGGRQLGAGTPSGMMTDTARAVRDVSSDILGKQSEALRAGYGEAAALAGTDLSRMGQLASTAGNIAEAQQRGTLSAAQQLQGLGTAGANLTQEQQRMLAQIGQTAGGFAGQDIARNLTGAQQLGSLAETARGLGTAGAGLTQEQQRLLASIGQTAGGFAGQDITRNLAGAQQLAEMGGTAQQLGLTGAGALQQVGGMQQGQAQKNLDLAYGDFLRQQGYPQEQINAMLQTFGGVKAGVPGAAREEGIVPMNYQSKLQPSTAETIGGALTGIAGILGQAQAGSALGKLLGV